jgi:hypothetical protein
MPEKFSVVTGPFKITHRIEIARSLQVNILNHPLFILVNIFASFEIQQKLNGL